MATVNVHYTFNYSQPHEYRFSHDSVFLSRRIYELLSTTDISDFRCLDIGSGSGIVGMDLLFHRYQAAQTMPSSFDFMEVQEVYRLHFEENVKRLGPVGTSLNFLNRNYDDLQTPEFQGVYDLMVSNPPYFFTWQGKLSPSEFKNRCRFFIDSDLKNLLWGIASGLKKTGKAFILLRDLPEHNWNVLKEAQEICLGKLNLEILGDIRGTHFLCLTRVTSSSLMT